MHHFQYVGDNLYCEDVPVAEIAQAVGTPLYLYSNATLRRHFRAFDNAFDAVPHLICFSMKSNSNLAILRLFAGEGGGVDIVSGGELYRALTAGVAPDKIVFSGVGKQAEDMKYALRSNVLMFNVESPQELYQLDAAARSLGKKAPVAIRVNPDVDPETHPYISTGLRENKFGIDIQEAPQYYETAAQLDNISVQGISCHIGSQLTQVSPFVDALRRLKGLLTTLDRSGIQIRYLDLGGGLGITYDQEEPPHPEQYAQAIQDELVRKDITLILEPGRVITGNAGILVSKVLYVKSTTEKTFIIVDAAMNDLMRPTLYGSYHGIQPIHRSRQGTVKADIVGPICETGDFLARDRNVDIYEPGDLLAVMSSGAYGFSMSSNYNSRPRACEVLVSGDKFHVIRSRETYEDLVRGETIPDFLLTG